MLRLFKFELLEPIIRLFSIIVFPAINKFGFKEFELLEPIITDELINILEEDVLILKLLLLTEKSKKVLEFLNIRRLLLVFE